MYLWDESQVDPLTLRLMLMSGHEGGTFARPLSNLSNMSPYQATSGFYFYMDEIIAISLDDIQSR